MGAVRVRVHHLRQQILVERTPVHTNAHRLSVIDCRLHDCREVGVAMLRADVAGIDAILVEGRCALGVLGQQQMPIVVKVADERHVESTIIEPLPNFRHRFCRFVIVDGDADNL